MNLRVALLAVVSTVAIGMWGLTCVAYTFDEVAAGVRPLEPREFEQLTLVTAGTGGAWENPMRLGPVLAVGFGSRIALVDAGRGSAEALRTAEIPITQPGAIYLTSLSPENTVGLDDLLLTSWLVGREAPLRVYGPPGTQALCRGIEHSHAVGIQARATSLSLPLAAATFDVVEVAGSMDDEIDGLRIRATPLESSGPSASGAELAWRFEGGGRVLVVAPNAGGEETLTEFAAGAHALVRSAAYAPTPEQARQAGVEIDDATLARDAALHSTFRDVGRLPEALDIDALVLVRVRPPPVFDVQVTNIVSEAFGGAVLVADDGDEINP